MRNLSLLLCLIALFGCDETVNVDSMAPEVDVTAYCQVGDEIRFVLSVQDHERDAVHVELRTSVGRVPSAATGHGFYGLSSEKDHGVEHMIVWGTDCDLLGAPLGDVTSCDPAPASAPDTLELTLLARDEDDEAELRAVTVERVDECP